MLPAKFTGWTDIRFEQMSYSGKCLYWRLEIPFRNYAGTIVCDSNCFSSIVYWKNACILTLEKSISKRKLRADGNYPRIILWTYSLQFFFQWLKMNTKPRIQVIPKNFRTLNLFVCVVMSFFRDTLVGYWILYWLSLPIKKISQKPRRKRFWHQYFRLDLKIRNWLNLSTKFF